ncbi:MAG: NAD(P)/FAD-dependent oxidoreductase, partial [Acidimicrobiales bacterium]|nr:NAD(P)/FAD-dependent oxidoreductase [Acidimicrobiales bacterium]
MPRHRAGGLARRGRRGRRPAGAVGPGALRACPDRAGAGLARFAPIAAEGERDVDEHWDVVVVGSGPGGLTAGACLAAAGRRVLVVERHDLAGGNAQVFRRHHEGVEYEFDVGVHYLGDCGPGGLFPSIFSGLGVGDRIDFRPLDPDGFDTLHFPDLTFRVPAGWDAYRDRLIEAFPDERAGLERAIDVLHGVAEESRARMIPGAETPTFDEWAFRPLSDLFDQAELSARAAAVLDHWSGLYAGGPSQTAIAMHAGIIDHYMRGAYYPEGGGQVIPARLVQVIEAFGGEVRTLTTVEEIVVTDRVARGVRLADGTMLHAPLVISNADHARTVLELTDTSQWDPATVRWTEEAEMTLGLACVYVVVDIDLTDRPNTNEFAFPTYDTDDLYARLDAGTLDEGDLFAYIAIASRKDPGNPHLCPPGHTNFQIMTLAPRGYEFWGVDDGPTHGVRYRRNDTYRDRKDDLTERLLDTAERILGPFRDHIVHLETATPL